MEKAKSTQVLEQLKDELKELKFNKSSLISRAIALHTSGLIYWGCSGMKLPDLIAQTATLDDICIFSAAVALGITHSVLGVHFEQQAKQAKQSIKNIEQQIESFENTNKGI